MATGLNAIFPDAPVIKLDKNRTLVLNWLGWKRLEGIYGDFMKVWSTLFRLTNSSAAVAFLHTITGVDVEAFTAAANLMQSQGPVMDDVAIVLWAACLEEAEDRGETLTIRQVERYLRPGKMSEYLDALRRVIENMATAENPQTPAPSA